MPEEIKQEVVIKTQKYLGKYVKKPPLTEKLLKKPPFRFLHDVINSVIKETGFLKGLFSNEELNSENVKEKEAKIAFLTKLIDAVKTITNTDLTVRPSKIIAGLEPTETNLLLQAIGKAIDKKLDSSEYVSQVQSGQIVSDKGKKNKKVSEKNDKVKKISKATVNKEEKRSTPRKNAKQSINNVETPKSTDRQEVKRTSKESKSDIKSKSKEKEKVNKKEKAKEKDNKISELNNQEINDIKNNVDSIKETNQDQSQVGQELEATTAIEIPNTNISSVKEIAPSSELKTDISAESTVDNEVVRKRSASASRPKSARPRSGDLIEKNKDKEQSTSNQGRPRSSLRPPSVRPSSARPGAPRLRPDSGFPVKEVIPMGKINVIVESFDKDVDEEETVVIQSNPEVTEDQNQNINVPVDNKGHLVEQILEQINENEKLTTKVDTDWQKDGFQRKDTTTKDTNSLRSLIQNLTKTANPLGKLLNYLHEDIDTMHTELESWTNIKRQLFEEIVKQKRLSAEMNKPLISQLDHINQEIKKMEEEIVNIRSNILRNEIKIKELLAK